MKAVIMGIAKVDYTKKDNKEVHGSSVYIVRDPNGRETTTRGQVCEGIWVADTSLLAPKLAKLALGMEHEFVYETDGRYSWLADIIPMG